MAHNDDEWNETIQRFAAMMREQAVELGEVPASDEVLRTEAEALLAEMDWLDTHAPALVHHAMWLADSVAGTELVTDPDALARTLFGYAHWALWRLQRDGVIRILR